jgi:cobalamin-dependent methionine synthase I
MLIVGERINTSRISVNEAVSNRDAAYIERVAKSQAEAGAELIDINAGSRRDTEVDDLRWMIEVIQKALPQIRLCLDSPNPESLKVIIDRVTNPPMLNSTTAERSRFEAMAPLIRKRECDIVALCIDERGVPKRTEQILENATRLVSDLEILGLERKRIYLDPVIQTISSNTDAALMVLEVIGNLKREFADVNVICGLSNISFGLPKRSLVNRTFLSLALKAGLDAAIIDPLDRELMGTLMVSEMLLGRDPWCQAYTKAFRTGRLER